MRCILSLVLLSGLAIGAPNLLSPVERDMSVFEIDRFYAGGLPPTNRNFVMFSIKPTAGAGFANCTVNTDTGPKVPTIEKLVCSDANSITWSLGPMGDGMHFSVWWAFTSHASLYGSIHFSQSDFKNTKYPDGAVVQTYVGRRKFTLSTTTVTQKPS